MYLGRTAAILLSAVSSFIVAEEVVVDMQGNLKDENMVRRGKALGDEPMHLGLGATTTSLTKITGMEWYEAYSKNTESDGNEGRLVSLHTFKEPWTSWEMHPVGEESVVCTAGEVTIIQDLDGSHVKTMLKIGEYVVNPKGVWHTADCDSECTVLFITPGRGTQHKPRD